MQDYKLTQGTQGYVISEICNSIKSTNKPLRVTIKEWKEVRSISQNSLYWKWLAEINKQAPLKCESKISGSEMWHEVFKHYYCPLKSIENKNAKLRVKSTKMLDVGEFTFYLSKIEQWCIDREIKLTIPIDSDYAKFMSSQSK